LHIFLKKDDLFELNWNEPNLEEESVSILFRPEITYFAKLISDHFQSIDTIPDMEFGMTQYA